MMPQPGRFTLTRFATKSAMKDEEYAYWQKQPTSACMQAVVELIDMTYGLENEPEHVRRLQRTLVRIERP